MRRSFGKRKNIYLLIYFMVAAIILSIGYAGIASLNLIIGGNATGTASQGNFKVKFKTASINQNYGTASITNDTTATLNINGGLVAEGDSVSATYTVKNESNGIGAAIRLRLTNSNTEYYSVTESIADTELQEGDTTTVTITVNMIKTPIENDVSTTIVGTLIVSPVENGQATGSIGATATPIPVPVSFATDSWETIQAAVQDNNTSAYNVGDTKEVTINNTDYTVRIANKTTGEHCGDNDLAYSQTACGFVVEFVDMITEMKMRDTTTNVGGYPATIVYNYLKDTLYGQLPGSLQSAIKSTRVISGYGSNGTDSSNFVTNDKLYLLSRVEVYGSTDDDTSAGTTTQLEFYQNSLNSKIKQYNSSDNWWWLRSAYSSNGSDFSRIRDSGVWAGTNANYSVGVAPAFRIG